MDILEGARIAAEFRHLGYKFYHDRVMVYMDKRETKTSGGLFLPEGSELPTYRGTIVAVGSGKEIAAAGVEVCDRIIVNKWNTTICSVARLDGSMVDVVAFHVYDLYIGWVDEDVKKAYYEELAKLRPEESTDY